ncbi:RING-type E3 ubiquitin transferase [Balamuthia mandrillaris]
MQAPRALGGMSNLLTAFAVQAPQQKKTLSGVTSAQRPTFIYLEEDAIDEELLCSICHTPFMKPVQTACCRACFCHDCISRTASCPLCRRSFAQAKELQEPSRLVNNLVNRLKVRCSHCSTECERGNFESHVEKQCPVLCPFGCGSQLTRASLVEHEEQCSEKQVPCQGADVGCVATMLQRHKKEHESSCAFVTLRPTLLAMQNRIKALEEQTSRQLSQLTDLFYNHHHSDKYLQLTNVTFHSVDKVRFGNQGTVFTNCAFKPGFRFGQPLKGVTFEKCILQGVDLTSCGTLESVTFRECNLHNAKFRGCTLTHVRFERGAALLCAPSKARFSSFQFALATADFIGATLDPSSRASAEQHGARLTHTSLTPPTFRTSSSLFSC